MHAPQKSKHSLSCPKCSKPIDVEVSATLELPEIDPLPTIEIKVVPLAGAGAADPKAK